MFKKRKPRLEDFPPHWDPSPGLYSAPPTEMMTAVNGSEGVGRSVTKHTGLRSLTIDDVCHQIIQRAPESAADETSLCWTQVIVSLRQRIDVKMNRF